MKPKKRSAPPRSRPDDLVYKHVALPRRLIRAIAERAKANHRSFQRQLLVELESGPVTQ